MSTPMVFNLYKNPELRKDPNYLYIGRPNKKISEPGSRYMNPYVMGKYTRNEVVDHFKIRMEYGLLMGHLDRNYFRVLENKVMGCYCKPLRCHGDVLSQICSASLCDVGWVLFMEELKSRQEVIFNNYIKPD